ncbi:unnamed protein product [Ostreobium quekettii]|uniref:Uncharacterized protein n=1 Tax=Ostreobium quekettii TaxID=121088 RepID=A0A8S1J4Q2_9CHLO|nr:unnamed protein product [Ostreobium quekettii]
MDRIWTALVLVAVLVLRGTAARDKANMPQPKQEEGPSNNATALGTIVKEPSEGGRIDPEVLAGMYNRSMDVPIGRDMPSMGLDGATIASLTKSANTSTANGTNLALVTANGTKPKGESLAVINATAHIDEATHARKGAMPNITVNATVQLDGATHLQMGALPNATNEAASEKIHSSGLGGRYEDENNPETITSGKRAWHLANRTRAGIEPTGALPNATNEAASEKIRISGLGGGYEDENNPEPITSGKRAWHLTNGTRAGIGPMPNATNGTQWANLPTGHNETLSNLSYTGPLSATNSLDNFVHNGEVFIDVEVAAQKYRLAPGEEPQASANRSNDPDVVAMKEIASVVLDGPKETAVIMTEVVIRSVLPDGENVTTVRDTELHEVIQGKFQDEGLMREILERDANQAQAIPEQGPCEACPQPVSAICSLCWPVDFCRPFASKVDIPCPAEQF